MVITIKNYIISESLFIILIFFTSNINLFSQTDADVIIAKIGNKTITKMEFMNRAEFTPRPDYCRLDNYVHKKIVLNTLIAEKLMAAEAGENNELTNTPEYAAYLTGRKEQAMRQIHYYEKAFVNSKPDSADVAKVFSIAGRTYNISYFRIKDSSQAHHVFEDLLNSKISFDSLFFALSPADTIPTKQISYLNQELPVIHEALFSNELIKGEILVPVYADDSYLFIRVDGWTDRVSLKRER